MSSPSAELKARFILINVKNNLRIKKTNIRCCAVEYNPDDNKRYQRFRYPKNFEKINPNEKFAFIDSNGYIIMSKDEIINNIDDNIDRLKDFSFYERIENIDGYELFTDTIDVYSDKLDLAINESMSRSSKERLARIKAKSTNQLKITVTTSIYDRDPDIIAETLFNANGFCGCCKHEAPFLRARGIRSGTPYLEVHHKIPMAEGGKDSLENTIALCPNCHRKAHFG